MYENVCMKIQLQSPCPSLASMHAWPEEVAIAQPSRGTPQTVPFHSHHDHDELTPGHLESSSAPHNIPALQEAASPQASEEATEGFCGCHSPSTCVRSENQDVKGPISQEELYTDGHWNSQLKQSLTIQA